LDFDGYFCAVKISVCIPAYKNAAYLDRNLNALLHQDFKDFEVILSDDSPDNSVLEIVKEYETKLQIRYFKNDPSLGTPANWNFAMQQAKGTYIKLIHDDDWLAGNDALGKFYDCLEANPEADFCFSAFQNVAIGSGKIEQVFCSVYLRNLLSRDRYNLFKRNFIGPPSVVFQRNNKTEWYDARLKWLVDFEGYIRFLGDRSKFVYINECLVNIGISAEQVTNQVQHDATVVLPESLYFLKKHGAGILKNIFVYDYFWRTMRNLGIKSLKDIHATGWQEEIPAEILQMLSFQQKVPASLVRFGASSKLFMTISYLVHR
jgi:glycosyltransferase involved in cell wall biosynthesis